jgi:hypothetical protein
VMTFDPIQLIHYHGQDFGWKPHCEDEESQWIRCLSTTKVRYAK